MTNRPRYSEFEIERRWLVDLAALGTLDGLPFREIDDLYFTGTRLRLRKITGGEGDVVFKLGKKYGRSSSFSEPLTNLYLSESEYKIFSRGEGKRLRKRRYALRGGGLDVYPGQPPLAIFEMEFAAESEALAFLPPDFVGREITGDATFTGAALAMIHGA